MKELKQAVYYFLILTVFTYSVINFSAGILDGAQLEVMGYYVGVMCVCYLALKGEG